MKNRRSEEKLEKLLVSFTENLTGETSRVVGLNPEEMDFPSEKEISSLFETVQTISSVIQPGELPEGIVNRISCTAKERFREQMSAEKIQKIIGMAVTMDDFRKSLFLDIITACRGVGLALTPKEIAALRNLKEDAIKEFANSLDERITKFFPANLP